MKKPVLIIISGLPGTGKSTLAANLSKKLSIPYFSVDPIESSIIKAGIEKSFETGLAAYMVAESLAKMHLALGIPVIIDAVSPVKEARDMWTRLSEDFKVKQIVIECITEKDLHERRIKNRIRGMHGLPEVSWEDVEKRRLVYLPWEGEVLRLDTGQNPKECLNRALEYIKTLK